MMEGHAPSPTLGLTRLALVSVLTTVLALELPQWVTLSITSSVRQHLQSVLVGCTRFWPEETLQAPTALAPYYAMFN